MARLPVLEPEAMTPEQKDIYNDTMNGPRKHVPPPVGVWLHRPGLARHAQALGSYARFGTCLSPRLSELTIMLVGRDWNAEFEWQAHKPLALAAGLSEKILDSIRDGNAPKFTAKDEALVYRFVRRLQTDRCIDDALYAEAVSILGEDGVLDLVGIFGFYSLVSATIQVFELSKTHCTGEPELSKK